MKLFENDLLTDEREPSFIFEMPFIGGNYGLLLPNGEFWKQLFLLSPVTLTILVLFATTIYKLIIKQRQKTPHFSYLIGFGIIIPVSIRIPYDIIELFHIRNRAIVMCTMFIPTVVIFRCMEAMYGFSPPVVEGSMSGYCQYCIAANEIEFDPVTKKPGKVGREELILSIWRAMSQMVMMSALFSVLRVYDYEVFETRVRSDSLDYGWREIFDLFHLLNNLIAAVAIFFSLALGPTLADVQAKLSNIKTKPSMSNPLLLSKSPSDFWTRWNITIHLGLKRGCYKPLRSFHFSKATASLLTFLASGILHVYIGDIMFGPRHDEKDVNGVCISRCVATSIWKPIIFFGYCGLIVGIELSSVGKWRVFRMIADTLPGPLVSLLILMIGLPLSHLFSDDWVKGGFFNDFSLGLFIVTPLNGE